MLVWVDLARDPKSLTTDEAREKLTALSPIAVKPAMINDIKERVIKMKIVGSGRDNMALAGGGILLIVVGGLGLLIYGFSLLMEAFEQGLIWTCPFLFFPISGFMLVTMPLYALILGVLSLLLMLFFIIFHWPSVRRPFVLQLYATNVLLLGYLLLISGP